MRGSAPPAPGHERELPLAQREQAIERLLPVGVARPRVDHPPLVERDLRLLTLPLERELPGLPVHGEDLQEVHERDLREVPLDLAALAGDRARRLDAPEDLLDPPEHLVVVEGLLEERAEPRAVDVHRLAGEHHRDPLGARVRPDDPDERTRVEHLAALVEEDHVREPQDRDLERTRAVARRVHLVAALPERRREPPHRGGVGVGDQDLPDGGHGRAG